MAARRRLHSCFGVHTYHALKARKKTEKMWRKCHYLLEEGKKEGKIKRKKESPEDKLIHGGIAIISGVDEGTTPMEDQIMLL
jgi:hypothetical protein